MPTILRDIIEKDSEQSGEYQDLLLRHQRGIPIPVPDPAKDWRRAGRFTDVFDSEVEYPANKWNEFSELTPLWKYSSYTAPGTKDLFVWQALKRFDPQMASLLRNATRRPGGLSGMYKNLKKFDDEAPSLDSLEGKAKLAMELALEQTRAEFRLEKPVEVASLEYAHLRGLEPSSAAGFSFPGFKKGEVLEEILEKARVIDAKWSQMQPTRYQHKRFQLPPCTAAQRGGPSIVGEEKTRLVWVYPAEIVNCEMRIALPLYDAYASRPCKPMLYGNHPDQMMNNWFARTNQLPFVGMDISGFDSTISDSLMSFAMNVVVAENCTFVNTDTYYKIKSETRRQRYLSHCEEQRTRYCYGIYNYLSHTPILMPDGRLFETHHGMPSGTAFTQLVDSICNTFYVYFAANMQGATIQNLIVLGDDSGFQSRTFDVVQASEDLKTHLNVTAHPDKCNWTSVASKFIMLGYSYKGCKRRREEGDWFLMALCPERRVTDIATSFGRLYGIFLAGAKDCDAFCRFLMYYQSGYEVPTEIKVPRALLVMLKRGLGLEVLPLIKISDERKLTISRLS